MVKACRKKQNQTLVECEGDDAFAMLLVDSLLSVVQSVPEYEVAVQPGGCHKLQLRHCDHVHDNICVTPLSVERNLCVSFEVPDIDSTFLLTAVENFTDTVPSHAVDVILKLVLDHLFVIVGLIG